MATLEVGVDVNESYIARLAIGTPADIVLDAYPEVHFPAEVRTIFPSADRDRATIPVRVRFVASDARVRPDLGAKVTFLERRPPEEITTVPRTIRIPRAAVFDRDGARIAWVVREGKLVAASLDLGEERGEEVEVRAGLTDGDQVVLGPAKGLRAGQRVRIAAG
jgi:multidrug efflux pump subunit AcrA (membrane-fusion protein)